MKVLLVKEHYVLPVRNLLLYDASKLVM